jgi:RNA polymerase sigma-70 factor (ECF subfamily)
MQAEAPRACRDQETQLGLDPAVIRRAARGDADAFSEIYAHSAPGVRRYVGTIIWNRWDAEDVTQEVFVKLYTGLPRYDPERALFTSWMLRVARNAAIDHLRRSACRPTHQISDQQRVFDDTGARCGEALLEALETLTESQRQILMLRALGGYTPPEIATGVRRTRGGINTLYHRARLAARDNLAAMRAGPCTQSAGECPRSEHGHAIGRAA